MSSAIAAFQKHPQFEKSDGEIPGKDVSAVTPTAKWYAGEEMV